MSFTGISRDGQSTNDRIRTERAAAKEALNSPQPAGVSSSAAKSASAAAAVGVSSAGALLSPVGRGVGFTGVDKAQTPLSALPTFDDIQHDEPQQNLNDNQFDGLTHEQQEMLMFEESADPEPDQQFTDYPMQSPGAQFEGFEGRVSSIGGSVG